MPDIMLHGWGCGTSCVQFAVVDLQSGKVTFPADFAVVTQEHFEAGDFDKVDAGDFNALRFKMDSQLLIVIGVHSIIEKHKEAYNAVFDF